MKKNRTYMHLNYGDSLSPHKLLAVYNAFREHLSQIPSGSLVDPRVIKNPYSNGALPLKGIKQRETFYFGNEHELILISFGNPANLRKISPLVRAEFERVYHLAVRVDGFDRGQREGFKETLEKLSGVKI